MSLKYIVKKPQTITENTPLLIMVHGYGSNEEDLFSFAGELPADFLIVSVRAPLEIGFGGYAWYTIHFNNSDGKFSDIDEAITARDQLSNFIDEIKTKYGIPSDRTFLMGFSQGTVLSYAVALNHPEKVQKILAMSGYINPDLLPQDLEKLDHSSLDFFHFSWNCRPGNSSTMGQSGTKFPYCAWNQTYLQRIPRWSRCSSSEFL